MDESETIGRRPFLKATSVGLVSAGLAGCSGDGGDGSDGALTATVASTADLSGVEIDFWERQYFDESPAAEEALNQIFSRFEEDTGATVNVNFQGEEQPLIDAFNQGTYPTGMTEFAQGMGVWQQTGQIEPFEEYQDQFERDVLGTIGALDQAMDYAYRGWDTGNTVCPVTANIFAPFVARTDLLEEAGLDPESDFPPENFDELVDMAETVEENSNAEIGYQPVHDTDDNQDVYFNQWMAAEAGEDGYFLNEDWSDLNVTKDVWYKWMENDIGMFTEMGFGTPDTPSMNDEEIPPLHMNGRVAISNQAPMNLPGFTERAPSQEFYDENFQWAPSFGLDTGVNGRALISGGVVMKPPEGADEATWEEKQDATIELLKFFNDPILQVETMPDLGFMPANEELWPEITDMNGFAETIKQTAKTAKYSYPAYPEAGPINYDIFGAKKQQASQGELTVDEVLEQTYEEGMEIVNETQWGSGG